MILSFLEWSKQQPQTAMFEAVFFLRFPEQTTPVGFLYSTQLIHLNLKYAHDK